MTAATAAERNEFPHKVNLDTGEIVAPSVAED